MSVQSMAIAVLLVSFLVMIFCCVSRLHMQ